MQSFDSSNIQGFKRSGEKRQTPGERGQASTVHGGEEEEARGEAGGEDQEVAGNRNEEATECNYERTGEFYGFN